MNVKYSKFLKASIAAFAIVSGTSVATTKQPVVPVSAETREAKEAVTLVNEKTTWKYFDKGSDPATPGDLQSWAKSNFDDSAWTSAAGKFGFKKGGANNQCH